MPNYGPWHDIMPLIYKPIYNPLCGILLPDKQHHTVVPLKPEGDGDVEPPFQHHRIAFATSRSRRYLGDSYNGILHLVDGVGHMAVPLYPQLPVQELQHILHDAQVHCIASDRKR